MPTASKNSINPRSAQQARNTAQSKPVNAEPELSADDIFGSALPGYADKPKMAEQRTRFTLTSVETRIDQEYGEQWVLNIALAETGEALVLTMDTHEKRDEQLLAAKTLIERKGPIENLCLRKSGQAFYINRVAAPSA